MAYDIGTARGVIELDYNGRGVQQAQADVTGLEKSTSKSKASMDKAARGAAIGGAAIAAGLALAVNSAANFEERMSAIKAVSGATESQMGSLSDKALQLGADTKFSAGEAATAMEELVKAGLSVDDVLNGAADATVALAAAGEVALPEAATIASNSMNQFNLKAEDMVGVVDDIAGAANSSAIDVSDFGQSLQQVGAVANLAGVDFKDTATAIAILGNAGIKGSDAGTSLKTMFQRLQPTTKKQSEEMKRLGLLTYDLGDANKALAQITGGDAQSSIKGVTDALSEYAEQQGAGTIGTQKNADAVDKLLMQYGGLKNSFYDAKGNTKDLASVSGQLQKALKGMSAQQRQAALNTLFGSDAIRAAAILSNEGAKGFKKMQEAMGKTSAADVAKTRMDNFKGSLEEMKGSLETAGIVLGTVLLPPLRKLVDALTTVINKFSGLGSGTQAAVVAFLAVVSAGLLIFAAVVKISRSIVILSEAMAVLRGTFIATWAAALGPIALVIAAVAAVIVIIILLWKHSETFRDIVLGVWEAIKTAAMAVATWFTSSFLPALQAVWDAIVNAVKIAFAIVATVITTYINIWKTIILGALNYIKTMWSAIWWALGPIVKAVFGLIAAIIKLAWTIIKGVVILNARYIKAVIVGTWNAIKAVTSAVWGAIKAVFTAVWGFIGPYVKTAVNAIKGAVESAWNAVKSKTTEIWNGLKSIVSGAIDSVMTLVNGIKARVTGAFSGAINWLTGAGKDIIQGLIDGIVGMIDDVTGAIGKVTSVISDHLPGSPVKEGPLRVLNRGYAGKQIVEMVIAGIDKMEQPTRQALDQAVPSPFDVWGKGRGWNITKEMAGQAAKSRARDNHAPNGPWGINNWEPKGTVKPKEPEKKGDVIRIAGNLELANGRAYITGIAEDVVDRNDATNSRRG